MKKIKAFKNLIIFTIVIALVTTVTLVATYKVYNSNGKLVADEYLLTKTEIINGLNQESGFVSEIRKDEMDPNLWECLRPIAEPAICMDGDGMRGCITKGNLEDVTELVCPGMNIKHLWYVNDSKFSPWSDPLDESDLGNILELMPNLTKIDLSNNDLQAETIIPQFDYRNYTTINLSNNPNLTNLSFGELNASGKNGLQYVSYLNLENTGLISLELPYSAVLKTLLISGTKIKTLDLTRVDNLVTVQIWNNKQLSEIKYASRANNRTLHLNDNGLTKINIDHAFNVPANKLRLSGNNLKKSVSVDGGKTVQLDSSDIFVLPSSGAVYTCSSTYTSNDTTIVSVNSSGVVTGINKGTTTVIETINCSDKSNRTNKMEKPVTIEYTVTSSASEVQKIELDCKNLELALGSSTPIEATVTPSNAVNKGISWSSSDYTVVSITAVPVQNGLITVINGVKEGEATITAKTKNGVSATCNVKVINQTPKEEVKSVRISTTNSDLKYKSDSSTIKVYYTNQNGEEKRIRSGDELWNVITWKNTDPSIVKLSSGSLTPLAVGSSKISVTLNGINSNQITINVLSMYEPVTDISIKNCESGTMKLTSDISRYSFETIVESEEADQTVTWKSSDPNVIMVKDTGLASILTIGNVTLTATTVGTDESGKAQSAVCNVVIETKDILAESIQLSTNEIEMQVGATRKVAAFVKPNDAINKNVIWRSSNENIAKVNYDGVIEAVGVGEATIGAFTSNNITASVNVKVTSGTYSLSISTNVTDAEMFFAKQAIASDVNAVITKANPGDKVYFVRFEKITPASLELEIKDSNGNSIPATIVNEFSGDIGYIYEFTMPESDVVAVLNDEEKTYSIIIHDGEKDELKTDKTSAKAKEQITITTEDNISNIMVETSDDEMLVQCQNKICTFEMPSSNVEVGIPKYTITNPVIVVDEQLVQPIISLEDGTSPVRVRSGKLVKVSFDGVIPEGYEVLSVIVNNGVTVKCDSNKTECTFIMPATNVEIEVEYKVKEYKVEIIETTNGTTTVDKNKAQHLETVTITNTPNEGYYVKSVIVKNGTANQTCNADKTSCRFEMPSVDVTIEVEYEAKEYTITYELNGGTFPSVTYTKYTVNDTITLMPAVKTGYNFLGWYTESTFVNKVERIEKGSTGNKTFYAKWEEVKEYTITYELNGGTFPSVTYTKYTINDTITLMPAVKTGYKFLGWYTESTFVNKVERIEKGSTGNKTFYAKWEEETYSITIKSSSNGTTTVDKENVKPGETVTIINTPQEGYVLGSIIVKTIDGNTVTVKVESGNYTFTMPENDVNIEATYHRVNGAFDYPVKNKYLLIKSQDNENGFKVGDVEFKLSKNEYSYVILDKQNVRKTADQVVVTGDKLEIHYTIPNPSEVLATYDIVIQGDTNGDGAIDVFDIVRINNHIIDKTKQLDPIYQVAADFQSNDEIDIYDIVRINNFIIGDN